MNSLNKRLSTLTHSLFLQVRDTLTEPPDDVPIPLDQVQNTCRTNYGYPDQPGAAGMPSHSGPILAMTLTLTSLFAKFI